MHELLKDDDQEDMGGEEEEEPEPEKAAVVEEASADGADGTDAAHGVKRPVASQEAKIPAMHGSETGAHATEPTAKRSRIPGLPAALAQRLQRHPPSEPAPPTLAQRLQRHPPSEPTPAQAPAAAAMAVPAVAPDVEEADRTAVLWIDGLVRPFTESGLRQMLAAEAGGDASDVIADLWLAGLKTHAIVTFSSVDLAEKVRRVLTRNSVLLRITS